MLSDIQNLKKENQRLSEDVIDSQARSMRDNLLFFNFEEKNTSDDRKSENCTDMILNLCENDLGMSGASDQIKIDRAHRIGNYVYGKKRPIVVKFNYYRDKVNVKQLFHDKMQGSTYRIGEQYPKVIQERRKLLIPELIKAKSNNQPAYLSYDKLYVNGKRVMPAAAGLGSTVAAT